MKPPETNPCLMGLSAAWMMELKMTNKVCTRYSRMIVYGLEAGLELRYRGNKVGICETCRHCTQIRDALVNALNAAKEALDI